MIRHVITAALMALVLGCATVGTKITQAQLSEIYEGKTNRADLISMFGPPTSESYSSTGEQILGWGYAHVGFAGSDYESQSVVITLGPDGTVSGYSRGGAGPIHDAPISGPAIHVAPPVQPTTETAAPNKSEWQKQQLEQLSNEKVLSYEEYMKRYRAITSE